MCTSKTDDFYLDALRAKDKLLADEPTKLGVEDEIQLPGQMCIRPDVLPTAQNYMTPITLIVRSQPLSDDKVTFIADFPDLKPTQMVMTPLSAVLTKKTASDCDDLDAIRELNNEDEHLFNSIQPYVYNSDSSTDDGEYANVSPTTKYVKKMLAKKALLNGASTAYIAAVRP